MRFVEALYDSLYFSAPAFFDRIEKLLVGKNGSGLVDAKRPIKMWLRKMHISDYTINNDLTVDVAGDVILEPQALNNISRLPVQFGIVRGDFHCASNSLSSMSGSPHEVHGYFLWSKTDITDLTGAPRIVHKNFECSNNDKLTSLAGAPDECQSFLCYYSPIKELGAFTCQIKHTFEHLYCTDKVTEHTYMGTVLNEDLLSRTPSIELTELYEPHPFTSHAMSIKITQSAIAQILLAHTLQRSLPAKTGFTKRQKI